MTPSPRHILGQALAACLAPRTQGDRVALAYGLHGQRRLFAYMLGYIGIGIPIFLWAAYYSIKGWPFFIYAGIIICNVLVFLWLARKTSLREAPEDADFLPPRLEEALWRQGFGAGLWTVALLVICISATLVGQKPEVLLMICAGAAVGIIFFSSPVQTFLLTLGPIAMAGPIIAFRLVAPNSDIANLISAGLILALAMAFVINRHLKEHYELRYRQAQLNIERERVQKSANIVHQSRAALLDTLSRDVQSGLGALESNLHHGLAYLSRAPAPREDVNAALNEVLRLKELISVTLDNGTLESGTLQVADHPLDLSAILADKVRHFTPIAQARGLNLSFDDKGIPAAGVAFGDDQRVRQILSHLIKNAIEYSSRGTIEIRIDVMGPFLRICIIDSGLGLSPEELQQAFLPYRRIKRTCSGLGGAGLGLSLSKSLAELMGAQLGAQSTCDVGSKFWLDLRFDPMGNGQKQNTEPALPVAQNPAKRVLLLSNDSLRAAQLRQWLEQQGHLCLLSTKVARAQSLIEKSPFDTIVISHDAFDEVEHLISELKASNSQALTRIIALLSDRQLSPTYEAYDVTTLIWPISKSALSRAMDVHSLAKVENGF